MIQWLRERQRQEGLRDNAFGHKLQLSRRHWQFIRTGIQKTLTHRVIRGALRAYPEHKDELLRLVTQNGK